MLVLSDKMCLELCLDLECRTAEVAEEEPVTRLRVSVLPIEAIFQTTWLRAIVSREQFVLLEVPMAVLALMAVPSYCQYELWYCVTSCGALLLTNQAFDLSTELVSF